MAILVCILIIILSLSIGLLIHSRKKKNSLLVLLPKQTKLIRELHSEIKHAKLELYFCKGTEESEAKKTYTLIDIAKFSENAHPLSGDNYDDCPVYFTSGVEQLIFFKKYLLNELLPEDIKEELKPFYNKTYKPIEAPNTSYLKIQLKTESNFGNLKTNKLYKASGDAFENWLSFTESAHDLAFLLKQLLNQNLAQKQVLVSEI